MDKQAPEKVEQFEKLLDRKCPACAAKLENHLPYCASCGVGLPKFPRPALLRVGSTLLFFLVGFPAGLGALYAFVYLIFGEWHSVLPIAIAATLCWALLWFMLEMCEGTRHYRLPTTRK